MPELLLAVFSVRSEPRMLFLGQDMFLHCKLHSTAIKAGEEGAFEGHEVGPDGCQETQDLMSMIRLDLINTAGLMEDAACFVHSTCYTAGSAGLVV